MSLNKTAWSIVNILGSFKIIKLIYKGTFKTFDVQTLFGVFPYEDQRKYLTKLKHTTKM